MNRINAHAQVMLLKKAGLFTLAIALTFIFTACSDDNGLNPNSGSTAGNRTAEDYHAMMIPREKSSMVIEYYEYLQPRYEGDYDGVLDKFLNYTNEYVIRWYLNDDLSQNGELIFDVERILIKSRLFTPHSPYDKEHITTQFDSTENHSGLPTFYCRYKLEKMPDGYSLSYALPQYFPGNVPDPESYYYSIEHPDKDLAGQHIPYYKGGDIVIKDGNVILGFDVVSSSVPSIFEKVSEDSYIFIDMDLMKGFPAVPITELKKLWNKIDKISIIKR